MQFEHPPLLRLLDSGDAEWSAGFSYWVDCSKGDSNDLLPTIAREFLEEALRFAARRDDIARLVQLAAVADVRAPNVFGQTALMLAADIGNARAVEFLLPLSDPLTADDDKETALFAAIAVNSVACAGLLAPVSNLDALNSHGYTPAYVAGWRGSVGMIGAVLGDSPEPSRLHEALRGCVINGHADAIAHLAGLSPKTARDWRDPDNGRDLLTLAAEHKREDAIKALLPFCEPAVVDKGGFCALSVAVKNDSIDCVQALLPHCGTLPDVHGISPFGLALSRRKLECAELLCDGQPKDMLRAAVARFAPERAPRAMAALERIELAEAMALAGGPPPLTDAQAQPASRRAPRTL